MLGSAGRVKIGNNVFIGMNTTILKGTQIGNNVIIGAGSVVSGVIPDNVVAVGNPCRVVMTLEEYHAKRKARQLEEATELVTLYRRAYGKEPDENTLYEFFWLFSDGESELAPKWQNTMKLMGNEKQSYSALKNNMKLFEDMEQFLNSIHAESLI